VKESRQFSSHPKPRLLRISTPSDAPLGPERGGRVRNRLTCSLLSRARENAGMSNLSVLRQDLPVREPQRTSAVGFLKKQAFPRTLPKL
jgi:hypothetical protein